MADEKVELEGCLSFHDVKDGLFRGEIRNEAPVVAHPQEQAKAAIRLLLEGAQQEVACSPRALHIAEVEGG